MRWPLATDDEGQGALFAEEMERHVGKGEYRGLEFLHVRARRIINEVPAASQVPFRYTINAYRGCSHACSYCLAGETPVLLADGRTRPLAELRKDDQVYGTVRRGAYRRYVATPVLDHWSTAKPAYRITLADGTELIASGDHRFLSARGWKYVTGREQGAGRRPHLTLNDKLMGTGQFAAPPAHDSCYRSGYLCGLLRGDAHVGSYDYPSVGRASGTVHRFRLALVDLEALRRAKEYLDGVGIRTDDFVSKDAVGSYKAMHGIRNQSAAGIAAVRSTMAWPDHPSASWAKGFLAGIFDAEGCHSGGVLRMSNKDPVILDWLVRCLDRFGFRFAMEVARQNGVVTLRVVGGLRERLRFFNLVDPAITRKRTITGMALKSDSDLGVVGIEPLGRSHRLFDITTGTGDFIANGVVSHNCFARPTHEYLDLDAGDDFDRRIVVKVNAVERLRAELAPGRWAGEHIAMGTNTDPYQRCEGKYHLTRGVLEELSRARNPFSILTKSTLILRDLPVLVEAASRTDVHANFSIGTLDEEVWRATEPGTPHPMRRIEAVARLNEAGIPCGVLVAPILPGLSDRREQLEAVVKLCVEAGARTIAPIVLHLRPGVREHFLGWLRAARPELVDTYEKRYLRAYLPKSEQSQITAVVGALVEKYRGCSAPARATRGAAAVSGAGPVRQKPPPSSKCQQLGFGL